MANNPFSEFSSLKSLKKEFEKQDDSKIPVKTSHRGPARRTGRSEASLMCMEPVW